MSLRLSRIELINQDDLKLRQVKFKEEFDTKGCNDSLDLANGYDFSCGKQKKDIFKDFENYSRTLLYFSES